MNEDVIFTQNKPLVPPPPPSYPPSTGNPSPGVPAQPPATSPPAPGSSKLKIIIAGVVGVIILLLIFFGAVMLLKNGPNLNNNVTLTYWGLWENSSVMQGIFADFHRANPHISVNYVEQDIKQYRDRLTTRINNGDGPDIFRYHNTWLPMLSGYLLPMPTSVITPQDFQKYYYPVTKTDITRSGAIFGIPLEIDTLELFTNDDMFQAAGAKIPDTWDDFSKVAHSLTVTDPITGNTKTAGAALGAYDNITHAPDIISLLFLQNGVDLKSMASSQSYTADALTYYMQFANSVWDPNREPSIQAFASGSVGMYFGYSWDIFTMKSINPNLKFHVNPVPRLLGGRRFTVASYWVEGVSSKSKNPGAAMLLMHYLAQKDTQQKIFTEESKLRAFGEPYARVDLAPLVKDNPLVYPFVEQAPTAVSTFFASDTYDDGLNDQANGYLGNAVRSMLGNTSAQSAVGTLTNGVTQVLNQYGK